MPLPVLPPFPFLQPDLHLVFAAATAWQASSPVEWVEQSVIPDPYFPLLAGSLHGKAAINITVER